MVDRTLISSYSCMGKKADIYFDPKSGYEIDFFLHNKYILSESYTDKNLYYHEDAAENYINGIKTV